MSLRFSCTCGKALQVADEFAGRSVRCPQCKEVLKAPRVSEGPLPLPISPREVPSGKSAAPREDGWATESYSLPTPPGLPREESFRRGTEEGNGARAKSIPPPLPQEEPLHLDTDDGRFTETSPRTAPPPLPVDNQPSLPERDLDADIESLGLVNHAGEPVDEEDDFFVRAPSKIGPVRSAHTTLKTHQGPWSWLARVGFIMPVGVMCLGLFIPLVIQVPELSWVVLVLLLVWAVIVLALTRFKHTVTYVGTHGLAEFTCGGKRKNVTSRNIFLFQDAIDLRTAQTNMYVNGIYTGTSYSFTWTDEEGGQVHQLSGNYWTKKDLPPPKDRFRYALAAEGAWTAYLFENMETHLVDRNGFLFFPLQKKDWVRVGTGVLRLFQGGQEVELPTEQIDKITMGQGIIFIHEVGSKAGWFSSTGVYQIVYKDLANARFFLLALDKLVGFKLY